MSPPRSPPRSRASTGSTSGPRGSRRARPPRSSASSARSTPPTSGSPATREPRIPGAPAGRRRRGCPPREPRAARPARPGALCGQVEPPRRARESRRDDARGGGARGCRGVRPRDPGGGRRRHRGARRARRGGPHPLSLRPRGLPRVSGVHAPRAGQRRRRRAVGRDRPGRRAGHDRGAPGHGPAGPGARERRPRVKVAIVTKRLDEVAADALVVGLYAAEKTLPDALVRLDRAAGGHLKAALEAESFKAKAGQVMHVHTGKSRVVVAGLGPRAEMTLEVLRRGAAAALRRARDLGARTVAAEVLGDRLPAPQRAQALVEGALLGTYTFDRYKKEQPERAAEQLTVGSGRLDRRNSEGMQRMKNDMAGAAAVLGIMGALAQLRLPVEVHGLLAATENMPSGTAVRPGDVLRAMNGTTIEVGNTDAEGRLTLADALCYAAARVKPDEVIDLATLTGACVIALGPLCAGLMANDQALAKRLLDAGELAGERLWQLPLIDEYREHLKSEVADLNNVGPRGGGAINAGLFLKEFAGDLPWAHLDIAGPAWSEKDLPLVPKGASGTAVRTILTYLAG